MMLAHCQADHMLLGKRGKARPRPHLPNGVHASGSTAAPHTAKWLLSTEENVRSRLIVIDTALNKKLLP